MVILLPSEVQQRYPRICNAISRYSGEPDLRNCAAVVCLAKRGHAYEGSWLQAAIATRHRHRVKA